MIESAGNPKARSPKQAVGLMQLTPIGVEEVRQQTGLFKHQCPDLYNPHVNVLIGSALLKHYLSVAGNDVKGALALYNGGFRAYRHYRKGTLHKIPETHSYLKKVCDHYKYCDEKIALPKNIYGSY